MFKLMINSVFGKPRECKNAVYFELVDNPVRFQKLVNKPTYKHRHTNKD